jgi:hypothetical protein
MSNAIAEQRKILRGKNYELDSRAWGVKDLGMLPKLSSDLNNRRTIDEIMTHTRGKSLDVTLHRYEKNFTPITTF